MKLYGGPISPFVRKVTYFAAYRKILPHLEFVRAPTAMAKPNLELMKMNPLSKIPTLETNDGTVIFDSDVILEYLDMLFPEIPLLPTSGETRWAVLKWNALASGALDALVLWRFERNRPPVQQSLDVLTAYQAKTEMALDYIEKNIELLSKLPFSIAHISLVCVFGYLDFRFPELQWRQSHPGCQMWYGRYESTKAARMTAPYNEGNQSDVSSDENKICWRG